ncbi:exported protein A EppA [Borreliella burgdorferi]|uniref:BapA n=2 Tax=Borreliella burgdorferi TaxID=139 RepID=A0A9N7B9R7_BORBG|nr:exported protein A EppA [Borreliella burgdorferi]ADQ44692.1 BapA [Borreliella burgdorferi 297]MCD2331689.1 exported protein A EppA [Borreliella burgdorferi]MCD2372038.1 exported protein A EppA [Borreliella burgdorferi]MCD2408902.1 exported protein A EppA [Borreliella burgdorferi]MCR8910167.1 exported protein A EppA [Borreliella burgdorferi 297]
MKKINLLIFLFLFVVSLSANIEENYTETKRAFSEEDFNLINKRLDNYDFKNEYEKSHVFSDAPRIRGDLRKIGIKEKRVFLDALEIIEYLIKIKISADSIFLSEDMIRLIGGYPDSIFNYLIQLNSDKIDYAEKYGDNARNNFKKDYSEDKANTVKQILKQILADLPKD